MPWRQVAVQHDLHTERCEVDVPRFDQRIEKRHAVVDRDVEDIRLEELEHDDPHLLVRPVGESSDEPEPVFIVRFLLRHALDDVQQFLRDEAFERPERLLFQYRTDGLFFAGFAFTENQLAHFLEQRRGWIHQLSLQSVRPQAVRQHGQLPGREPQERLHLVVNIGALRRRRRLLPGQQLGNVRLGYFGGRRQISLLGPHFLEPMSDEEPEIHDECSRG